MLELIPVCLRQLPSLNPFKMGKWSLPQGSGQTFKRSRSVENQYKRVVFGYMVIYHLCQFIEIVHKIINWYMKNPK